MSYKRISPTPVAEGGTGAQTLGSTQILVGSGTSPITSTSNATINTGTGAITLNSGTGSLSVSTDSSATTLNIATGGAVKTTTIGSTNTTSPTTIQSGSGGISLATSSNGSISLTSGTGAINIGTNANAKTITIGATTTTSATNINVGTGNMTVASATGTLITQKSTGEMTRPFQPCFLYYLSTTTGGVTGNNTTYTLGTDALTSLFDQGNNCTTAGVFTAPVTGIYFFSVQILMGSVTAAMLNGQLRIVTTAFTYYSENNPGIIKDSNNNVSNTLSVFASMTAGDTATVNINYLLGATNAATVVGSSSSIQTYFSGYLSC